MDEIIKPSNFIEDIIDDDLKSGKHKAIATRFPPEPNGCLHIGHSKAVCINFGIKEKYHGTCNLRFDDTNPVKEDVEYVNSIMSDIAWLGFSWDAVYYASDYFEEMYNRAVMLIKKGLAYVCDLSAEEIAKTRGTLTEPGVESPYRNRSIDENLRLFSEMRDGKYADGEKVLRAKIDMAANNINMRDPVMYRILHTTHHRQGNKWVIYPMYDFAHPLEDAIEHITHSCCSLEFEDHRPLYDWFVVNCEFDPKPRQIEFARLNVTRTVMSKRYLRQLVEEGIVNGWNDPRMPTIGGMRERGYPAEAIRDFCSRIGVAKANSEVDIALLEHCVRENLNANATRVMAVLRPLKLIIENYPEGKSEVVELENNQNAENAGVHTTTFSRELYIEETDFALDPPPKYFRLKPGGMVRLKGAYIVEYTGCKQDKDGNVIEVACKYIEDSKSGGVNAGIKVKGVIHWVNANDCADVKVNLFDYLFSDGEGDFMERVNKNSKTVLTAKAEKYILDSKPYDKYQFMRQGYFVAVGGFDKSSPEFNETVGLKDSFNK
jgi:glutaminyl-tRNA synthetase